MKWFDYSKLVERKFDHEIISYIAQIHEYKGRQQLYLQQKPDELEKLVEIAKRQSTESSNAIEGIRTTNARLNALMNEKVNPRNRSEEEIIGYRNVLNIIHESYEYVPIRSNYILQLHKMLYSFSNQSFAGKYKDVSNEIDAKYPDGKIVCIFKPLEPFETPYAVERLCDEYNKAIERYNIEPLIAIPIFIHDFLCIHPFNDGNGRMSRLLTTLLLYKSGYVVGKYISIEKKIEITKEEYYDALSKSSENWHENANDDTPFIKYMLGVILAAYRDFEERVNIVGNKVTSKEMVEKAVYSKIGTFTKSDIMELCPEISKASVESSLKKLCDEGRIAKVGGGRSTYYYRRD
ncbi:Fic family protein [Floccifex sp.]|uniref:Fic family protein n=1 Tax=Floccifex sp. TaxID=2815810 RepID=UPI002A759F7E|nr:Fic family protein [Floccifex sp.]MDD7280823.1 Fic family protein [Erysipelotrichaceae bacterium]MDY2958142.1 Fic family protein [Floccifex sp.]